MSANSRLASAYATAAVGLASSSSWPKARSLLASARWVSAIASSRAVSLSSLALSRYCRQSVPKTRSTTTSAPTMVDSNRYPALRNSPDDAALAPIARLKSSSAALSPPA